MECITVWLQQGGKFNQWCYFYKAILKFSFSQSFFLVHKIICACIKWFSNSLGFHKETITFWVKCSYPSHNWTSFGRKFTLQFRYMAVSGTALHTWTHEASFLRLGGVLENCLLICLYGSHWRGFIWSALLIDDIFTIVSSNVSSQIVFNPSVWITIVSISLKLPATSIVFAKSTFVAWKMSEAAFDATRWCQTMSAWLQMILYV